MNQTISTIEQLTETTSEHAEQNKQASMQLESLAVTLNNLIAQFKVS